MKSLLTTFWAFNLNQPVYEEEEESSSGLVRAAGHPPALLALPSAANINQTELLAAQHSSIYSCQHLRQRRQRVSFITRLLSHSTATAVHVPSTLRLSNSSKYFRLNLEFGHDRGGVVAGKPCKRYRSRQVASWCTNLKITLGGPVDVHTVCDQQILDAA